jgi:pimeloyl-ACP methyl ester carboxylesterase
MGNVTRAGVAAAVAAAQVGLAYRFALAYRARAGYPRRNPPTITPAALGLPFEPVTVPSGELELPGWFIPARGGAAGPGVALVHGWESARDRTLPMAMFLHAAGFHCLTIDVRAHGANPPESLPMSAGEFGLDALAAFRALLARDEVTEAAISGHSMGAIGAILAAAAEPRVAAVVATSGPADPYRLTRQTFRLARLPIPDPIAYPLAWLTTRVYLKPRGHVVDEVSATTAIARYRGPILLAHGDLDQVVPFGHMSRLAAAARRARAGRDAGRQGRPTLLALRGTALSLHGRPIPREGARRTDPAGPGGGHRRGDLR